MIVGSHRPAAYRAGCVVVSAALVACYRPAELRVDPPELSGFRTLLVDDGAGVDVHRLSGPDELALRWRSTGADDVLRLGLYRGRVEDLALEVEDGQLRLDMSGVAIPPPTSAFVVDGSGELRADVRLDWSVRRRIHRRGCEPMAVAATWTPTHAITFYEMVPRPTGDVVAVATIGEATRAVVIDSASIRPLFPRARAAFQGIDGAAWVILPDAMVRLNDDDSVAERVDATDLHLVAAAEAPDGPRFVVLDGLGKVMRWDGIGDPTPVDASGFRFGYATRYDLFAASDGEIWLSGRDSLAHFREGRGWVMDELLSADAFGVRLVNTRRFGLVLSVEVLDERLGVTWYVRREAEWVPILERGVLSGVDVAERGSTLVGISRDGVVEVDPGVEERGVSTCVVTGISPPHRLVSTRRGILFVGGFSMGWLGAR